MNGNSIPARLWRRTINYRFNLLMAITALVVLNFPLQHYIGLNRYQHVGIAIFLFGTGYVMQLIWSWKRWSRWARISHCGTAAFFCAVGCFFYTNNWMDFSENTLQKSLHRLIVTFVYLLFALVVSILWIKALWEDQKAEERKKLAALKIDVDPLKQSGGETNSEETK